MHKVKINGKTCYAENGTILYNVLTKHSFSSEHPCGGKGICKKCSVIVNGKEELSCRYEIKSDIVVELPEKEEIFSDSGIEETGVMTEKLCLSLDIGTTTLALALVSLDRKNTVKVISRTNPQRRFGADVISRIEYCVKNGINELHNVLIDEINSMITELDVINIKDMYVAGNTVMLHIFYGVDCSTLGVAPYKPVFLEGKREKAEKLGVIGVENIELLPSIASFAGADLVAGLNYVSIPEKNRYSMLVDLGTNAEIILFSESEIICTSAAAGPCFEGNNIRCGMSATDGAIYAYSDGKIKTVGNVSAKGICGTGLIDIVSEFIENGTVDESGYMECEEVELSDGVYICQADIRQYQLAKSAVYSAIMTLLKTKNVSFDKIDKIYILCGCHQSRNFFPIAAVSQHL